jgi:hypothetical protein
MDSPTEYLYIGEPHTDDYEGDVRLDDIMLFLPETGCCTGRVGDANGSGGDVPTIGDVTILIDALFVSADAGLLECLTEADVNQSGGAVPQASDITVGDISLLIDALFIAVDLSLLPDCL